MTNILYHFSSPGLVEWMNTAIHQLPLQGQDADVATEIVRPWCVASYLGCKFSQPSKNMVHRAILRTSYSGNFISSQWKWTGEHQNFYFDLKQGQWHYAYAAPMLQAPCPDWVQIHAPHIRLCMVAFAVPARSTTNARHRYKHKPLSHPTRSPRGMN
jgi:hypothetical protein